jgi:hypothetical protein
MASQVFIAHAEGDEDLARQLAEKIHAVGYLVDCKAFALVGASVIAQETKYLQSGGPVVLCGTRSAVGSTSTSNLINAARARGVPLFPVKMDLDANISLLIPSDVVVADCATNFESGVASLIASLAARCPVEFEPSPLIQSSSEPPAFLSSFCTG